MLTIRLEERRNVELRNKEGFSCDAYWQRERAPSNSVYLQWTTDGSCCAHALACPPCLLKEIWAHTPIEGAFDQASHANREILKHPESFSESGANPSQLGTELTQRSDSSLTCFCPSCNRTASLADICKGHSPHLRFRTPHHPGLTVSCTVSGRYAHTYMHSKCCCLPWGF